MAKRYRRATWWKRLRITTNYGAEYEVELDRLPKSHVEIQETIVKLLRKEKEPWRSITYLNPRDYPTTRTFLKKWSTPERMKIERDFRRTRAYKEGTADFDRRTAKAEAALKKIEPRLKRLEKQIDTRWKNSLEYRRFMKVWEAKQRKIRNSPEYKRAMKTWEARLKKAALEIKMEKLSLKKKKLKKKKKAIV